MTNKDARMWLKEYRKNTDFPMPQYEEALDMAIQALQENDEIRIGDEVYAKEHGDKFVVTIIANNKCCGFTESGLLCAEMDEANLKKTGKHFPQIEEVMKELGGRA